MTSDDLKKAGGPRPPAERTRGKETTAGGSRLERPGPTITWELFHALLEIAGQQIDPASAEVGWWYAQTAHPYGVWQNIPEEYQQIGREYFARAPGTRIWVNFDDLPKATEDALWKAHSSKLAFPAGL
jgi:hypothetical protein